MSLLIVYANDSGKNLYPHKNICFRDKSFAIQHVCMMVITEALLALRATKETPVSQEMLE